jgi:NADH-quinone oxidoreductase subunit N
MTIYALYNLSIDQKVYLLNFSIIITPMNQFIKVIILLITSLILIISFYFIDKNLFEFCILMLLTTFGLLILTCVNDLILISLSLELQSLGLYVLIGFLTKSSLSKEATLKYFIFGSFSSVFIGFGISLIYTEFGTTNLNELNLLINNFFVNELLVYGLFFF